MERLLEPVLYIFVCLSLEIIVGTLSKMSFLGDRNKVHHFIALKKKIIVIIT